VEHTESEFQGEYERIVGETARVNETLRGEGFDLKASYAVELAHERDNVGEAVAARAFWLELPTGIDHGVNQSRSGKLFVPQTPNSELVAIYAGLPGEDTVKREQRFANGLTKAGFTVWVTRHNGIRLTPENEPLYVNAPQVMYDAGVRGTSTIGGELRPEFLQDFVEEPYADLSVFANTERFTNIHLVGHSFGATSIVNALQRLNREGRSEIVSKVKRAVLMNGLLGDGTLGQTDDEPIAGGMRIARAPFVAAYTKLTNQYFAVCQPLEITASLQAILQENYAAPLPESVRLVITASPTDMYLTLDAAKRFQQFQARGLLIADLTESSAKLPRQNASPVFGAEFHEIMPSDVAAANQAARAEYGGSQHSAPNFRPETLVRLLRLPDTNQQHVVTYSAEQ
jgi:pimeloyl-ACP methyl ester carboxylesterase